MPKNPEETDPTEPDARFYQIDEEELFPIKPPPDDHRGNESNYLNFLISKVYKSRKNTEENLKNLRNLQNYIFDRNRPLPEDAIRKLIKFEKWYKIALLEPASITTHKILKTSLLNKSLFDNFQDRWIFPPKKTEELPVMEALFQKCDTPYPPIIEFSELLTTLPPQEAVLLFYNQSQKPTPYVDESHFLSNAYRYKTLSLAYQPEYEHDSQVMCPKQYFPVLLIRNMDKQNILQIYLDLPERIDRKDFRGISKGNFSDAFSESELFFTWQGGKIEHNTLLENFKSLFDV